MLWSQHRSGAYELTFTAIEILKAATFHLRKLKTNYPELCKPWIRNGCEECTYCGQGKSFLGFKWDPIEDRIKFEVTKRHVLRTISRVLIYVE
ncbi:hypothetical protein NPIL_12851 [Nephila pilipes]|uniref:Uncharacterized protein n=1 Tax=Nephila pilipes TaxID=299642 RepID=A0A8X6QH66_NEPPI|nr:hypothetical protein NPIL_12851 [Nephila pilipes]